MKQNDLGGLFTNPLIMNAISQFNPQQGQRLQDLALQQRQHQESQRQQQEFELKQQEDIRQQTLAKSLPQALRGIDFSDPNTAYQQLVQVGLKPQEALPIIAQFANINAGKEQSELNKQRFGLEEKEYGLKEQELGLKRAKNAFDMSGASKPEDVYKVEKDLRDAAAKETKNYKFVKTAVKNIITNSKHGNAISDTAMVYNFVNVLDPGNSVREGDTITIANAPGLPEQWRAKLNKAKGQGGLDPVTRKEIIKSSISILKNHEASVKSINEENERLAKAYKVNPQNVSYPIEQFNTEQEEETPLVDNINEFGGGNVQYDKKKAQDELDRIARGERQ